MCQSLPGTPVRIRVKECVFLPKDPWCRHREVEREDAGSEHVQSAGKKAGVCQWSSQPAPTGSGSMNGAEASCYPVRPGAQRFPLSLSGTRSSGLSLLFQAEGYLCNLRKLNFLPGC